jgi:multidrug efflux pump subunit AcrA (membrane-fusion protein)
MPKTILLFVAAVLIVVVLAGGLFAAPLWWDTLLQFLDLSPGAASAGEADEHDHGPPTSVKLTPQGRANLGLVVEPIALGDYWRTTQMPGMVIDRPGESDRSVPAPVAGVVTRILARQGDLVRPGSPLFVLKLASESLQSSQTELLRQTRDLEINKAEQARYSTPELKALNPGRLIDLDYQRRRLEAGIQAQRQDLAARGLTPAQIEQVAEGRFLTEITVHAPTPSNSAGEVVYDVEELRTRLGDQVQAGQALCILADHQRLYIEGHALAQEVGLLQEVARQQRPVRIEFLTGPGISPPQTSPELTIRHIANKLDAESHSLRFYLELPNLHQESDAESPGNVTHRHWRYRPGQQVRLHVPVEEFKQKFVLPAGAVVREGSEAYVFRASGDRFERRPVHVLYQDRQVAVLEPSDSEITVGNYIARNSAAALNRAMKAQAESGGHGHHHDHDH